MLGISILTNLKKDKALICQKHKLYLVFVFTTMILDDELKEESTDQNSQDAISQTSQETLGSSEKVLEIREKQVETEDDIGKPNFETAPNISMEETQEDHSQVTIGY